MKSNDLTAKDQNANAAEIGGLTASDAAAHLADIAARKARLAGALAETQQQRKSNQIVNDAQAALENIDAGVSAAPEAGPPGSARARVIGIFRTSKASQRAPLLGVAARLVVNEKPVDEQKTDSLGMVELKFPDEKAVDAKLQVMGTNGAVVASENITAAKEQAPVRLFELPSSTALAGPFDHAKQWLDARAAAASNLADLTGQVQKALAKQEEELQALIAAADAELRQPRPAPPVVETDPEPPKEPARKQVKPKR